MDILKHSSSKVYLATYALNNVVYIYLDTAFVKYKNSEGILMQPEFQTTVLSTGVHSTLHIGSKQGYIYCVNIFVV